MAMVPAQVMIPSRKEHKFVDISHRFPLKRTAYYSVKFIILLFCKCSGVCWSTIFLEYIGKFHNLKIDKI